MDDEPLPQDPAAFEARMNQISRRAAQAAEDARMTVTNSQKRLAQMANEQLSREEAEREAEAREIEEEIARYDVRDVPELQAWAEQLGYKHGYACAPLRFSDFHRIMRREHGRDYPGLEPKCYESYYVAGHIRGEAAMIAQSEYALSHGESRPPVAPIIRDGERVD